MRAGHLDLTPHQAKYFAFDLTRVSPGSADRLSMSLFDAAVDLNPHQIEAALFALHSPLSKGVMLADEVGLGKTIEAGIVLCQMWAERKRRLLVICPASLRAQWAAELSEKFNLPARVVDAKTRREALRQGNDLLQGPHVAVASFHYVHALRDEFALMPWDLVVIDEAHKLRNVYRPNNKVGKGIKFATQGRRKLLLTATPLQNSLLELYGLSTLIDDHIFGDADSFRSQYMAAGSSLDPLRQRVRSFTTRTLRKNVTEYIRYTHRLPITQPFHPSDDEQSLYEGASRFLQQDDLYSLPDQQRHLTTLILRKLLASSSHAIAGTLTKMRDRLLRIAEDRDDITDDWILSLDDDLEGVDELLDEILAEVDDDTADTDEAAPQSDQINLSRLRDELVELERLIALADSIEEDAKAPALLKAVELGFDKMGKLGAARKALVFTESRRTQQYLKAYLEANGYAGKVVAFNGTNGGPEAGAIYDRWLSEARQSGRRQSSRAIDVRAALIEHFRDEAQIMLATEAAAEGVNLQFCSLVVNYDLPWNPQRVEQRIGRCHRYGQQHDVVVVNFLNERNEADKRVLELLGEKFRLFDGVFGASDEILGSVESGVDFEQRVLAIYQQCRTPADIQEAFDDLQQEMEGRIEARMEATRVTLLEHFDEEVHQRLRLRLDDARAQLDRYGQRFWAVTRHVLADFAEFDDVLLNFDLSSTPIPTAPTGRYHLVSKASPGALAGELYRVSHPLGEYVVDTAKQLDTPSGRLVFDVSAHPARVLMVESLRGSTGILALERLIVDSFEREEYLIFSGMLADGRAVDAETLEKLVAVPATFAEVPAIHDRLLPDLSAESAHQASAALSRSLDMNSEHFRDARDRLEQWADDMVLSAEKAIADTKQRIKVLRREARVAATLAEQHAIQEQLKKLERQQRKQRQEIFDVEDEIAERRDELIVALERRMSQGSTRETLFTVEFEVV